MKKQIDTDMLDFDISKLSEFERYVISLSKANRLLNMPQISVKKGFNDKLQDVLKSMSKAKSVKTNYIYIIFNPIFRHKLGRLFLVKSADELSVFGYMLSDEKENKSDYKIDETSFGIPLYVDIEKLVKIDRRAFSSSVEHDEIDETLMTKINDASLVSSIFTDAESNSKNDITEEVNLLLLSPFSLLEKRVIDKMLSNTQIFEWIINMRPIVFASTKKSAENHKITNILKKLSDTFELSFSNGTAVLLSFEEGLIYGKKMKGVKEKVFAGKKEIKSAKTKIGKAEELVKTGIELSVTGKEEERILVKIKEK